MKHKLSFCLILLIIISGLSTYLVYNYNLYLTNNDYEESLAQDTFLEENIDEEEQTKSNVIYLTSYVELSEKLSDENITILVIGQTGCSHCTSYIGTIESVSTEYNIEIIYFNVKEISDDDYNSFFSSQIKIPASCSTTGEEVYVGSGFGTPLTLMIQNNNTVDCIRGNVSKETLVNKLKTMSLID